MTHSSQYQPGGRVGITDATAAETLPAELTTLAAWVACIAVRAAGVDVDAVLRYAGLARRAAADGALGYALMIGEKPG